MFDPYVTADASTLVCHDAGILTAGGWARGTLATLPGTRFFDWIKSAFNGSLTLKDAWVDALGGGSSDSARFQPAWIEAVVDFSNLGGGDPRMIAQRDVREIKAVLASGAVITGLLVVPVGAELPDVTGDVQSDLRVVVGATIERDGAILVADAALLLNFARVVLIAAS